LSDEEGRQILAKIAVKNHHNGTLSPKAHFQREITVEAALNAPIISWPLGLFDACGVSDGGAAAIVTTPEIAKGLKKDYILVKAQQIAVGGNQLKLQSGRDFYHIQENDEASKRAYQEAGITNPRKEIDLAEVHDCFTITELLTYEGLGFSPPGKGPEDVEAGSFTLEGDLPVNPDGGLKCFGHPISASGIRMTYEVYKQLQGKAGPRQVKDARTGLTHSLGGNLGQHVCAVSIFGMPD
jgi:acetyl-CoA C-acetyltransferase